MSYLCYSQTTRFSSSPFRRCSRQSSALPTLLFSLPSYALLIRSLSSLFISTPTPVKSEHVHSNSSQFHCPAFHFWTMPLPCITSQFNSYAARFYSHPTHNSSIPCLAFPGHSLSIFAFPVPVVAHLFITIPKLVSSYLITAHPCRSG